jgi:mannose-6-phosphate isomerase-like protein (cupin superfamily)
MEHGMPKDETGSTGIFDIKSIADSLPDTATTLLVDKYLTNREQASARIFRVYRPTPAHYHATCDEYLYVFSGRGTFWMRDASTKAEFRPASCYSLNVGPYMQCPSSLNIPSYSSLSIPSTRADGHHFRRPKGRFA